MNTTISGSRLRKELGRQIPLHRLTISESSRSVTVQLDSVQELSFVVGLAARHQLPVLPVAGGGRTLSLPGWQVRIDFGRLRAIAEFSPAAGVVRVQAGIPLSDLSDWLSEKGFALAMRPDTGQEMELWEYLLSPASGSYGPRHGSKWEQVFALTAVLPSGRLFANSVAPARATGPDFARLILLGQGLMGLPCEFHLKVYPLPRRRCHLAFALVDLAAAVEACWQVAREARPEFIELGYMPGRSGAPDAFLLVELWGEGGALAVRRELTGKLLGASATPTDVPHEVLLGLEDTYQFDGGDSVQLHMSRPALAELIRGDWQRLGRGAFGRLRIRGFADGFAGVTVDHRLACDLSPQPRCEVEAYESPDGRRLLAAAAAAGDPGGVLASIPQLWQTALDQVGKGRR